jgi:pimeloyl-ACP methyl ester carboxylesterase
LTRPAIKEFGRSYPVSSTARYNTAASPSFSKHFRDPRVVKTWRLAAAPALGLTLAFAQHAAGDAAPPHARPPLSRGESLALTASAAGDPLSRYGTRNWLRERLVRDSDLERYGLVLDDDWQRAPAHRSIVILVHGFNSGPEQNAALMKPIHARRFACGAFVYPNDHTIAASAQLMSRELKRFAGRFPERRIALVCHSMGGLVARACIEDPTLDPGNVERLVMIAPPTHGTLVAHFAVGTDLYEHWLTRKNGGPWRRIRDSIIDGLGEAADELRPESEFLRELNGRPRTARVRYSLFLGTGGCLSDAQVAWIRESFCDALAKVPGADERAERLETVLADIDELVAGKGDGIVAVKRGRLDGVADTVIMPFGHMAVTGEPSNDTLREFQQAVLQRVQ